MKTNNSAGQSGFALFGALLIVPLVLAIGLAVIDISGWNSLRASLQLAADQMAFQGASALPDRQAVAATVSSAAARLAIPGLEADVSFPEPRDLEVAVRLKARFRGPALAMLGVLDQGLTVEKEGRAAVIPKDVVMIIGLGSSLRPAASPQVYSDLIAWGSIADWPRSGYYDCALAPQMADSSVWPDWGRWADPNFQRWATESCFNPVLSAVKLAAIGVIDSVSQAHENRIGVIITPGRTPAERFQILSAVSFAGADSAGDPPVAWQPYRESRLLLGDEVCVLFSDPASAFNYRYKLTGPISQPVRFAEVGSCTDRFKSPPCGREHFPFDGGSDCYFQTNLSLRDSLYWRAARVAPDGAAVSPAIESAVITGLGQLLIDPGNSGAMLERELRGNVSGRSKKQLLVLTDFLEPLSISMQSALSAAVRSGIRVVFAVTRHEGLPEADLKALTLRVADFRSFALANNGMTGRIELIDSDSPEDLLLRAGPYMQNLDREVVLRR